MALTLNEPGATIYANLINQFLYQLQQPAGAQELGDYEISNNSYASGAFFTCNILFESRVSVPVSMSIDTSIDSLHSLNSPSTGHITMGGCQCFASSTGIATSVHCGGKYTAQY